MSLAPSLDASRAKSSSFVAAPHILALGALALCAFSLSVLNDGDTWSHIATGELDSRPPRRPARRSVLAHLRRRALGGPRMAVGSAFRPRLSRRRLGRR